MCWEKEERIENTSSEFRGIEAGNEDQDCRDFYSCLDEDDDEDDENLDDTDEEDTVKKEELVEA